ncbi:distal tail protein Dit [Schleiferilactobacillus harbinensis]|uniref:distal tail protein Dit n=1 Tax=Schleiferilactobacillus harbinensis TaxID=304207 RepID=UPI0039EC104B
MASGMSIQFNGYELNEWIAVTQIDIQNLPTTNPQAVEVGLTPGQTLLSNKWATRTITLTYQLLDQSYKHDLAGALGSSDNQPAQLILGNEPDKYYLAVPVGGDSQTLGPVVGPVSGGSLTFTCYDPYIYSTNEVTADNSAESNTITITNPGTAAAPVDLSATMTSDNGYFSGQIALGGSAAAGDLKGQATPNGDKVNVDFNVGFQDGKLVGTQNKYPTHHFPTSPINGVWAVKSMGNKAGKDEVAYVNTYGTPAKPAFGQIYGASLYFPYSTPSTHVLSWSTLMLDTSYNKNKNYGAVEVSLVDSNGAGIAGYYFNKVQGTTDHIDLQLWVGDDVVADWNDTKNTSWLLANFDGPVQIEKNGADIVFTFNNKTFKSGYKRTFHYSGLENTKVAGVLYYAGQWGGSSAALPILDLGVGYAQGISYSTKWQTTANLFYSGSTVDLISSDGALVKVNVNGLPAYDVMDHSSTQLMVPAQSTAYIYLDWSDSATAPTVTATLRPRYI